MERVRDLLRRSLGSSLRELCDEDRLHAAWPLVCGSALAAKADVLYLDAEGLLHVRVKDPEWRDRFFEVRSQLSDDLRRVAGAPLGGIHFEQGSGRTVGSGAGRVLQPGKTKTAFVRSVRRPVSRAPRATRLSKPPTGDAQT